MRNFNRIWDKVISNGSIHRSIRMLAMAMFMTFIISCSPINKDLPVIKEQGSFAIGGSVIKSPGKFDPIKRTPEGQTFHGDLIAFDSTTNMDLIDQPLLMMAGSEADTWYMTDSAYRLATGMKNKELFLIEGATNIQTYYIPEYVVQVISKLRELFGNYL